MPKKQKFDDLLVEYRAHYNLEDDFTTPNDIANLRSLVRHYVAQENLQTRYNTITDQINDPETTNDLAIDLANQLKKMSDSIRDLSSVILSLERQLGIDKKTRNAEKEQSVLDYIQWLKKTAKGFLEPEYRLQKIYCKACNIMVGRISGVYDTTYYKGTFQCPQCDKKITVTRKAKDIFYDLEEDDKDWRRKYPVEIVQPVVGQESIFDELNEMDTNDGELFIGSQGAAQPASEDAGDGIEEESKNG